MTSISYRKTGDDEEPVFIVDGQAVPGDATVTLPARYVAQLAHNAATSAAKSALSGQLQEVSVVERDDNGRIVQTRKHWEPLA